MRRIRLKTVFLFLQESVDFVNELHQLLRVVLVRSICAELHPIFAVLTLHIFALPAMRGLEHRCIEKVGTVALQARCGRKVR